MDGMVRLPPSKIGNNCVQVCREASMGYVVLFPYHTTSRAAEIARKFNNRVVLFTGLPLVIYSDRDPLFTSNLWKALWRLWGTTINFSTSYQKSVQGTIERTVQTVELCIRNLILAAKESSIEFDWEEELRQVEFLVNTLNTRAGEGPSPFHVLFAREPRTPLSWLSRRQPEIGIPDLATFNSRRQAIYQLVLDHARRASEDSLAFQNSKRRDVRYEVGESGGFVDQKYQRRTPGPGIPVQF